MTTVEQVKKVAGGRKDFEKFMNDRGEMRNMPFRIVRTKVLRNERLERRVIEENRERNLLYIMLCGSLLLLFSLM